LGVLVVFGGHPSVEGESHGLLPRWWRPPVVRLVAPRHGSLDQPEQGASDRRGEDWVLLRKLDS
jgi:hypothetical protein